MGAVRGMGGKRKMAAVVGGGNVRGADEVEKINGYEKGGQRAFLASTQCGTPAVW